METEEVPEERRIGLNVKLPNKRFKSGPDEWRIGLIVKLPNSRFKSVPDEWSLGLYLIEDSSQYQNLIPDKVLTRMIIILRKNTIKKNDIRKNSILKKRKTTLKTKKKTTKKLKKYHYVARKPKTQLIRRVWIKTPGHGSNPYTE